MVLTTSGSLSERHVAPADVHEVLSRYLIADGLPICFDLQASEGSWIVDARTQRRYVDFYSFFASLPLGFQHPVFANPVVRERLLQAAIHKPSNSDADSVELAEFVETFARVALPKDFRHLFFVEGGALAVENALKAAFDWKVRKNIAAGRSPAGSQVLHFCQAFHGRSGYTLSLTNTKPIKVAHFPRFEWPRVSNPKVRFPTDGAELERVVAAERQSIEEIEQAFVDNPHDIAAIIIEPIQGEGGDNHFRAEFLQELRRIADEEDALLIFDEVQTGFGLTGRFWAFEHFGVVPDIVSFGKKSQVCGMMAGKRLDEVDDNVFHVSSRINSTWGGSLVDMVRCQAILEVMESDNLLEDVEQNGELLRAGLQKLAAKHSWMTNIRGRGLLCAFECPDDEIRDTVLERTLAEGVLLLPCGEKSIRMRPALTIKGADIDEACVRLDRALGAIQ